MRAKYSGSLCERKDLSGAAEKVPGWVQRLLIPTLEAKVRSVVAEELAKFEKTVDARFEALDSKMDARFKAVNAKIEVVNTRIDSLEKQFPTLKELAEIKARLSQIEKASR